MVSTSNHTQHEQAVEVLATVAHDVRNYLQGILGYAEMLLEEGGGVPSTDTELLKLIQRNALGAHLLMANYLDLSRIEAGVFSLTRQPVHLDHLLNQVVARYAFEARRKQITFDWQSPQDLPIIWGEAVALERVFSNLVDNALKFTPAQGRITLHVACHHRELAISLTDTGCGITPADLSLVFVKGWGVTANGFSEGAGLGLFIVKTLVEAHAGRIMVKSALGQGSCFTVFLPYESS